MIKKAVSIFLKAAVSSAILLFLFRRIDAALFWKTFTSVDLPTAALAALILFGTQAVSVFRWSIILRKDLKISYWRLFSIYFIGMFFNNFLPTMVGGDVVKGYYLYRYSNRGDLSAASIFMDRYSGFTALMTITALSLLAWYPFVKGTGLIGFFALLIGGFLSASLVIWVGPLHSWAMRLIGKAHVYGIGRKADTLYRALMSYKSKPGILIKSFICSVFVQTGVIIGYYTLSRGIGMDLRLQHFLLFIPLTTAVSMLPVSLSGLGIREGAFVFLFTMAGAKQEQALALSLIWFVMAACISLIGGIEYIRAGAAKADA